MVYVKIPEAHDARGFLVLAKSGLPVRCLPDNVYGVDPAHLKVLERNKVRFKRLLARHVRLPRSPLAA